MNEDVIMIGCIITFIIALIVSAMCCLQYTNSDYNDECLYEFALNYCENNSMFLYSVATSYFYCESGERDTKTDHFDFSAKERDYCRIKDAETFKEHISKWETNK